MKRIISLLMTVVLLVLAVVAAVPSAFASAVDLADSAYSLATPSFKVERGAKGILVTWNADSGVDHYRVYHKTADGWSKVADNIKVGYYFDTSVVKGKSYTFTVRGLNSSDSFVTDFNRNGVSVTFTPDSDKYLLGDTDMDGMVTVMDSTHIQRKLAELKADEYKYINYLGDSDNDGLNITDATRIQRYIAQIPIPYPVGGKLLGLSEAPTEAPAVAPTEVAVDAPKNVKVTGSTTGKKEYAEVVMYGYHTNLMNNNNWIYTDGTSNSFWKHLSTDDKWVNTRLEQLGDGKVRFYFDPVTPDGVTSIFTFVAWGEGSNDHTTVVVSGDKLKLGYCDHQLPVVSTTNPSIKVSWDKSSNADSYEVRALDAKGNAVSSVVRTGSTSATVTLNTADAGTYSVEVKAVKGNKSAMAKGTFSLSTEFVTESEGSTIKVPVIFQCDRFVCNKCGREVSGDVKDHIIPIDSTELREKYADRLYTYQYKPVCYPAWIAAWAGTPDVTLTAGYYDLGDYYYHPLFSDDPDYTINYVTEDSLERPVSMSTKFSLAELEAKIRSTGNQKYIDKGTDSWLNYSMVGFHMLIEGCSGSYHNEGCISIAGLKEAVIPATGYTKVALSDGSVPVVKPTESPSENPTEETKLNTPTLNCEVTAGSASYNKIISHRLYNKSVNSWGDYTTIDGTVTPKTLGNLNTTYVSDDGLLGRSFGMNYRLDYIGTKVRATVNLDPEYVKSYVKNDGDLRLYCKWAVDNYGMNYFPLEGVYAEGITSGTVTVEFDLLRRVYKETEFDLSWDSQEGVCYYVTVRDKDNTVVKTVHYSAANNCKFTSGAFYSESRLEAGKEYTIVLTAYKGKQSVSVTKKFLFSEVHIPLNTNTDEYYYIDQAVTWK